LTSSTPRAAEAREHAALLLHRLARHIPLDERSSLLDVGTADGAYVEALRDAGFAAVGVEPRSEVRGANIEDGRAEDLPFPDASFDLVISMSVMEHVDSPEEAAREAHRVLKPGGGFYFATTSVLCPRQSEIRGFPAFPWYPDAAKRRIMDWALRKRPELIAHTTTPAYHWFSPRKAERLARANGFSRMLDRWDLHVVEEMGAWRGRACRVARAGAPMRHLAGVFVEGSSYLFIK
jgi:SAM-dependent methyltransferase